MTLTEVEKCWLVALYDDGYRYLARDNPEYLGAYTRKPHRTSLGAWDEFCGRLWYIPAKNFRFIDEKTLFKISCVAYLF